MSTFKSHFHSNFQTCITVLLPVVAMLFLSPGLTYVITGSLCFLTPSPIFAYPLNSTSGNHHLFSLKDHFFIGLIIRWLLAILICIPNDEYGFWKFKNVSGTCFRALSVFSVTMHILNEKIKLYEWVRYF